MVQYAIYFCLRQPADACLVDHPRILNESNGTLLKDYSIQIRRFNMIERVPI